MGKKFYVQGMVYADYNGSVNRVKSYLKVIARSGSKQDATNGDEQEQGMQQQTEENDNNGEQIGNDGTGQHTPKVPAQRRKGTLQANPSRNEPTDWKQQGEIRSPVMEHKDTAEDLDMF
ncbi:hypothetical protein ACA910_007496 [Epithemia clementina (nom. ined.)]